MQYPVVFVLYWSLILVLSYEKEVGMKRLCKEWLSPEIAMHHSSISISKWYCNGSYHCKMVRVTLLRKTIIGENFCWFWGIHYCMGDILFLETCLLLGFMLYLVVRCNVVGEMIHHETLCLIGGFWSKRHSVMLWDGNIAMIEIALCCDMPYLRGQETFW